jgi:hypothetical protein
MSDSVSNTPLPQFDTDEAAQRFVAEADLTRFDLSGGSLVQYEFRTTKDDDAVPALRPDGAGKD